MGARIVLTDEAFDKAMFDIKSLNWKTRFEAVDLLEMTPKKQMSVVVEELSTLLLADEDVRVRKIAAETLGKLEDKRASKALLEAANDPELGIRIKSLAALGNLHEQAAFDLFVQLLEDKSQHYNIRSVAVGSLSKYEDNRSYK